MKYDIHADSLSEAVVMLVDCLRAQATEDGALTKTRIVLMDGSVVTIALRDGWPKGKTTLKKRQIGDTKTVGGVDYTCRQARSIEGYGLVNSRGPMLEWIAADGSEL